MVAALLPASAKPGVKAELRSAWLVENYIKIVTRVLEARSQTSACKDRWTFTPAIAIEALPIEQRACAQKTYAAVTRETEADVSRATEDTWSLYQSSLGFALSEDLATQLKREWLIREYVNIVSGVVSAAPGRSGDSTSTARAGAQRAGDLRASVAVASSGAPQESSTPRRKIRRRGSEMSTSVALHRASEMKTWCAADMHAPDSWQEDRWNIFTGAVIAADAAPREAGTGGKKVFNAVLEDRTGVISLGAWQHHADELASVLTQIEHASEQEPDAEFWLRVELFSINYMQGSVGELCPIGVMQTIHAANVKRNSVATSCSRDVGMVDASLGTQFKIVKANEVQTPDMLRSASLRSSITGVTDFEALGQLHPPFRTNIAGVVVKVSDVQPTVGGSGKPVRTLVLSDPKGYHITIRQLGSSAEDMEICRQRHIVVYFATGRKAWKQGEDGSLWAYEDSYVKVSSLAKFVPQLVKEVSIKAE